jgi:hypothetical protein
MIEELMFWLVSHLNGMTGLTLIFVILFFVIACIGIRDMEASRRDSKRRNQAHPWRK